MRTTYHVWHEGDPSVGISGDQAEFTIEVEPADSEADRHIREAIKAAFAQIWDVKHVIVMKESECMDDST